MTRDDYLRSNGSDRFLWVPVIITVLAAIALITQLT